MRSHLEEDTWKADHSVLYACCRDYIYRWRWLAIIPSKGVLLGNVGKLCIHFSWFHVVLFNWLAAICPEPVFIQRIYMNRKAEGVSSTYACYTYELLNSKYGLPNPIHQSTYYHRVETGSKVTYLSTTGPVWSNQEEVSCLWSHRHLLSLSLDRFNLILVPVDCHPIFGWKKWGLVFNLRSVER